MDVVLSAVVGAVGGLTVAVVSPFVSSSLLVRSIATHAGRRSNKMHEALASGSLTPYWNELPIGAAEIGDKLLSETIGRVLSAPMDSDAQRDEAGNARTRLGQLKAGR